MKITLPPIKLLRTGQKQLRDFSLEEMEAYATQAAEEAVRICAAICMEVSSNMYSKADALVDPERGETEQYTSAGWHSMCLADSFYKHFGLTDENTTPK